MNRTPSEKSRLERQISRLYFSGTLQEEIAVQLKISQPTVSRYLKLSIARWAAESVQQINDCKKRELCKIDTVELEYWDAWRAAKEDPRFLNGVISCIDRRCKILGIDAPEKREMSGTIGVRSLQDLTDEELQRRINDLEKRASISSRVDNYEMPD